MFFPESKPLSCTWRLKNDNFHSLPIDILMKTCYHFFKINRNPVGSYFGNCFKSLALGWRASSEALHFFIFPRNDDSKKRGETNVAVPKYFYRPVLHVRRIFGACASVDHRAAVLCPDPAAGKAEPRRHRKTSEILIGTNFNFLLEEDFQLCLSKH